MGATDTAYGMDDSHYGEPLKARDGLSLYTHKLTDGDHYYEDSEFKAAMDAARGFGIPALGVYHVLHGGKSLTRQAQWLIDRLDALTPWWRDHPCFLIQADAEPFSYLQTPTITEVNGFLDEVRRLAPKAVVALRELSYTPEWHYGTALKGLHYRWWSSKYGSNPVGLYRSVYPGNASPRWNGVINAFLLQYGSNTIIAGQPTSDANAFRGSEEDLLKAFGASSTPVPPGGEEVMALRFQFADDVVGKPIEVGMNVHVSNGVSYHLVSPSGKWQNPLTAAGAGVIQMMDNAKLGGANYKDAVANLCGYLDTGQSNASGITADQAADIADERIGVATLKPGA